VGERLFGCKKVQFCINSKLFLTLSSPVGRLTGHFLGGGFSEAARATGSPAGRPTGFLGSPTHGADRDVWVIASTANWVGAAPIFGRYI
jgi:hypothetical protein